MVDTSQLLQEAWKATYHPMFFLQVLYILSQKSAFFPTWTVDIYIVHCTIFQVIL